jgi:hypothetical protein
MAKRSHQQVSHQQLSQQEHTVQTAAPQSMEEGILSAITNAVCPHCGGAMLGFQCIGECRRDWHNEWAAIQNAAPASTAKRRVQ